MKQVRDAHRELTPHLPDNNIDSPSSLSALPSFAGVSAAPPTRSQHTDPSFLSSRLALTSFANSLRQLRDANREAEEEAQARRERA